MCRLFPRPSYAPVACLPSPWSRVAGGGGVSLATLVVDLIVTALLTVGALTPSSTGLEVNPAISSLANVVARLDAVNRTASTSLEATANAWGGVLADNVICTANCAPVQGSTVPLNGEVPIVATPLPVPVGETTNPSLLWLVCV